MQHRLLHQNAGQRTFAVVLSSGDRVMENLLGFAKEQNIRAAQLTGIGAFSEVTLKYFDWETKKYQDIPVREQVEVASFIGDVAVAPSGEPTLHIHLVVGRRDGSAVAGHLGEGIVRPTLELIVEESPAHLQKVKDQETGLALIKLDAGKK
jgi:predicted DNA-binding protein with PD1-like motif